MMRFQVLVLLFLSLILVACTTSHPDKPAGNVPSLEFRDEQNHAFVLSNKISGFYVGHSQKENKSRYEGWVVDENHYVLDYHLFVDNKKLERHNITLFRYFPFGFERHFHSGIIEKFILPDSLDVIIVQVEGSGQISMQVQAGDSTLKINKQNPHVLIKTEQKQLDIVLKNPQAKVFQFWFILNQSFPVEELTDKTYRQLYRNAEKKARIKNFETDNDVLDKATLWAGFALDALVTKQRGPGIWAGLPWFNNYWGRDTFISFAGAFLVTGKFEQAKNILENFAGFQLKDKSNRNFGRIPNRITNTEIIYNTTDATWWFIRELYEYYLYSGDKGFVLQMFPVVKDAIEGALTYRCDNAYFLVHEDADTWMDAKGADGAWSPRGNRAVEIQALWYTALQIGAQLADLSMANDVSGRIWHDISTQLAGNFNQHFWDPERECLFDHLNSDNQPDTALRPNQIFAVTVPNLFGIEPLIEQGKQEKVARIVTEELTLPYGVLSLWHKDSNFHPYHHFQPYYPPDAAYHNGIIWTWLAGPVITGMTQFQQEDLAGEFILNEARQILNNDAIGNYSELLEPLPRPGKTAPAISGTISQAWNLAEFQRNLYQDIVGYHPVAGDSLIIIRPHLPKNISRIQTRVPYKSRFINLVLFKEKGNCTIFLQSDLREKILGKLETPDGKKVTDFTLPDLNVQFQTTFSIHPEPVGSTNLKQDKWSFASIDKDRKFPVISDPGYDILEAEQVFLSPDEKGKLVLSKTDPLQDDYGLNGKYVYPLNQAFKPGILDIESLSIYDMEKAWGFNIKMRHLHNPGWHPEFGFQLTFLAVAIRDESTDEPFINETGKGSNHSLTEQRAYNRIIYIGGGFEILDSSGQRLAQYIPLNIEYPLGFVKRNQIRFQIPKIYLAGLNTNSVITVLSGAQDDHGGAGIGDFRSVREKAGEWHGGGAINNESASTVYDILEIN